MELTPLGYIVIIFIAVFAAFTIYNVFFYDEHQQDPGYCDVYARQHLNDWKNIPLPYRVKESVAKESCTTPHWVFICGDDSSLRNRPDCWVARSEPKFQIVGVSP